MQGIAGLGGSQFGIGGSQGCLRQSPSLPLAAGTRCILILLSRSRATRSGQTRLRGCKRSLGNGHRIFCPLRRIFVRIGKDRLNR